MVRRDTREKITVKADDVKMEVEALLDTIQKDLFNKAAAHREENSFVVDEYDSFQQINDEKGGFIYAHWCGDGDCELRIKDDTKATIRAIPENNPQEDGVCIKCGNPSKERVIFAKAY